MNGLGSDVWLNWHGIALHESLLLSVLVSTILVVMAWLTGRHLQRTAMVSPAVHAAYSMMRNAVAEVVPDKDVDRVLPFEPLRLGVRFVVPEQGTRWHFR